MTHREVLGVEDVIHCGVLRCGVVLVVELTRGWGDTACCVVLGGGGGRCCGGVELWQLIIPHSSAV